MNRTLQMPDGRLSAIAASLANHPPITPVELLRCDPVTYDAVAAHLAAVGVRLENDTTLEFAICQP